MDYTSVYHSPLGAIMLACDGHALTGLWFYGQAHFAASLDIIHREEPHPVLTETAKLLDRYFAGERLYVRPPLHLRGTMFQRSVWMMLQTIPYGETVTYGDLAYSLSPTVSPQAIGNALARNPISIIIPCHRVIAAGGSLSGYAGGPRRKELLLALEHGEDISACAHEWADSGQATP